MEHMSRVGESSPTRHRVLRWTLWLAAGIGFGLLAGFAAALSKPREEPEDAAPADQADGGDW
jgi:hypothetical protein